MVFAGTSSTSLVLEVVPVIETAAAYRPTALCFIFSERAAWGGGGADFLFLLYFPCSAGHERDCGHRLKYTINIIRFLRLATNTLNVRNNSINNNNSVLCRYRLALIRKETRWTIPFIVQLTRARYICLDRMYTVRLYRRQDST